MLPNGASDWVRRGHSHHFSPVVLHEGAGEDEGTTGVTDETLTVGRAAIIRAAWAVGLKLVRMGWKVGVRRGGDAAANGAAAMTVGKHRAPPAVLQLYRGEVLRVAAQGLVAGGGETADFSKRGGISGHGRKHRDRGRFRVGSGGCL